MVGDISIFLGAVSLTMPPGWESFFMTFEIQREIIDFLKRWILFLIKYLVYWRDRPFSLPSKLRMFNHFLLHIFIHAYRSSHAKVLRKKDVLKNYFLLRSALNNLSGHYDPSFLSSRPLHTYHPINSFSPALYWEKFISIPTWWLII